MEFPLSHSFHFFLVSIPKNHKTLWHVKNSVKQRTRKKNKKIPTIERNKKAIRDLPTTLSICILKS